MPRAFAWAAILAVLLVPWIPAAAALPSDCPSVRQVGSLTHVGAGSCPVPALPVVPGMEPSCFERAIEPSGGGACCDQAPACCKDVSCCALDPLCVARVVLLLVRERIGQQLGDGGVCLDFGQDDEGHPYANLDGTRPCVPP